MLKKSILIKALYRVTADMFGPSRFPYDEDDCVDIEDKNPPKILYHVTHKKNLKSILKKGLIPKVGEVTRSAHGDSLNPATPMVYLSDVIAPGILGKHGKDAIIVSVDPSKNDIWFFTGYELVAVDSTGWGKTISEGDFPVGIEAGDFFSEDIVTPEKFYDYKGKELKSVSLAATVPERFKAKVYYHGTPTGERANSAWKEGIRPDLSNTPTTDISRPVAGRVYITDSLKYAVIYALGGDYVGSDCEDRIKKYGKYCYLFVIDGATLHKDVQADEDQIGEAVYLNQKDSTKFPWIKSLAIRYLDIAEADDPEFYQSLLDEVKFGLYDAWIRAGHILLPHLSDDQQIEIMEHFGNVAHMGLVKPKEIWEFDRTLCKELKRDGSNFFDLAKLKGKR